MSTFKQFAVDKMLCKQAQGDVYRLLALLVLGFLAHVVSSQCAAGTYQGMKKNYIFIFFKALPSALEPMRFPPPCPCYPLVLPYLLQALFVKATEMLFHLLCLAVQQRLVVPFLHPQQLIWLL